MSVVGWWFLNNHLILFERNRSCLTFYLQECKLWNLLFPPCQQDLFYPSLIPIQCLENSSSSTCLFAACTLQVFKHPHGTMTASCSSLCRAGHPQFFLCRAPPCLSSRGCIYPTLQLHSLSYLWVSVFFPKVSEPEDSLGRQDQESSGFLTLQIGSYTHLSSSCSSFLLQPACSLHCSFIVCSSRLGCWVGSFPGMLPGFSALSSLPISCFFLLCLWLLQSVLRTLSLNLWNFFQWTLEVFHGE